MYGLDDRLEEADVTDASMRRNGAATVALVESADLRFDATTKDEFEDRVPELGEYDPNFL